MVIVALWPSFALAVQQAIPLANADGSINAAAFTDLSAAATSPVSAGKTILISTPTSCNTLTISRDRSLRVIKGGLIAVAKGNTLTINGPFYSGLHQVFSGSGNVKFGGHREIESDWFGDDLTNAPIQHAINSLDPDSGGRLSISKAGSYLITTPLTMFGKSNVTISGKGKGETILRMDLQNTPAPSPRPSNGGWGILSLDSAIGGTGPAKNITVSDITFELINTGKNPGSYTGKEGILYNAKNLYFGHVQGLNLERLGIVNSRWEALYGDGAIGESPSRVTVRDCSFHNTQHNAFNVNAANASDITVRNCFFENCALGSTVVARRINVSNNIFKNSTAPITVAETSYPSATTTASSVIISSNIIDGMGSMATTSSNVYGISVFGGISPTTDGNIDHGIIITGNTITNSVLKATNQGPLHAIHVHGNAKISNNLISGFRREAGASGTSVGIAAMIGSHSGKHKQQTFLENNILAEPLDGSDHWSQGLYLTGDADTFYYLSNNKILAVDNNWALYIPSIHGSDTPFVSLSGDIFNGDIFLAGKWTTYRFPGMLDNKPLYGDSNGSLSTSASRGIITATLPINSSTPSVKGLNWAFVSNSSPTTISNFMNGLTGQEITLIFTNGNTTINKSAHISMKTPGAIPANTARTFFFDGGSTWYEK